ncbi:hypothetical protein [Eubacterium maltosivorans]|uniref:hypothetical protein n=1 Tax=Eubacterium maltosivorans TaxID=2041044 RepID=UPI001FAC9CC1|nr:hypothetical protein [Eubacterium maltosivorans]
MNIGELDHPQPQLAAAHRVFFYRQAVRLHKNAVSRQQADPGQGGHDCFLHL